MHGVNSPALDKGVVPLTGCRFWDSRPGHVWIRPAFRVDCTGSRLSYWSLSATRKKGPTGQISA